MGGHARAPPSPGLWLQHGFRPEVGRRRKARPDRGTSVARALQSGCNKGVHVMSYDRIEKANWQGFFARVSKAVEGRAVDLEVIELDVGDQVETDGLTLIGMTYDPHDDAIYLAVEGKDAQHLEHVIRSPQEVYVDIGSVGISQVVVIEPKGGRQFVKLRQPLSLAAEASH